MQGKRSLWKGQITRTVTGETKSKVKNPEATREIMETMGTNVNGSGRKDGEDFHKTTHHRANVSEDDIIKLC